MTKDEFKQRLVEARQERPKVFEAAVSDAPASDRQIESLERLLGFSLEDSHREFLQKFGGGEFGFGVLFSADPESEWYVYTQLKQSGLDASSFVPVSDNFAGDAYGFRVERGRCKKPVVVWDHEIGGIRETDFGDVYEFMDRYALRPA
jgi:hypothetical protein